MSTKHNNSDSSVIRLTLATVVAFALTGVAILVQASTQIPVASGSQRWSELSGSGTNQTIDELLSQLDASTVSSSTELVPLTPRQPVNTPNAPIDVLSRDQLTQKTLTILSLRSEFVTIASDDNIAEIALADVALTEEAYSSETLNRPLIVNVNTFLLSHRISDQSQLAELQMHPYFGEFDSGLFQENTDLTDKIDSMSIDANNIEPRFNTYAGIGFPHIETNKRSNTDRYKPYKQLVSFSSNDNGAIVPHIKCMGLSPQRVAKRAEKYHEKIYELAVKNNVSVSLVKAVVAKESCFNPAAVSPVGAIGLMQLMPETARWLKVQQPENAHQNLEGGVRYLAQLRKRFGSNELALAAYNAGPGNVERYNGIPPFAETQSYVQDVLYFYRGYVATTRFLNAQNTIEL